MDIRSRILARRDLDSLRALRELDGLAKALNDSPEMEIQQTFISARALLTRCANGADILHALETAAPFNTAVAWAVKFLAQDAGLDIGDVGALALLDQLQQAGVLQAAWVDQIKHLALKPKYVTRDQVKDAMFNDDGSEK
jgi:hypothetical protein